MSNLSCFLSQNKIKKANLKYVASKNFIDENRNPIEWEIRELTNAESDDIKKQCSIKVRNKNTYTMEFDSDQYGAKVAAKCTVFPDLNDAKLQDSYGVMGDDALLKAMLSLGEYTDYCAKVLEHNDFDKSLNDKVEEAKN